MKNIKKVELYVKENIPVGNDKFSTIESVVDSEIVEKELRHCDREKFIVLHLNIKNKILSYEVVSTGSLTASIVHPREVYKGAILANAARVILLHNHPSGDPEPSQDDKDITRRLNQAGKLLGINVLDHIIIAGNKYYSFSQHNLL